MFNSPIISSLNVNGIDAHWHLFSSFLLTSKADVICVQETHRLDVSRTTFWAKKNDFMIFLNCIDVNEIWHDNPEGKKLCFQGTAFFVRKKLAPNFVIDHHINSA